MNQYYCIFDISDICIGYSFFIIPLFPITIGLEDIFSGKYYGRKYDFENNEWTDEYDEAILATVPQFNMTMDTKLDLILSILCGKELSAPLAIEPHDILQAVGRETTISAVDGAEWKPIVRYEILQPGNVPTEVLWKGKTYNVLQPHLSQVGWEPDKTPSLFTEKKEEFAEWKQPQGGHDAYSIGDKVTHKSKKWESTANANVWEPGVYGWQEI